MYQMCILVSNLSLKLLELFLHCMTTNFRRHREKYVNRLLLFIKTGSLYLLTLWLSKSSQMISVSSSHNVLNGRPPLCGLVDISCRSVEYSEVVRWLPVAVIDSTLSPSLPPLLTLSLSPFSAASSLPSHTDLPSPSPRCCLTIRQWHLSYSCP